MAIKSNNRENKHRLLKAAALLIWLLAAIPPLLVDLGRRDAARVMENIAMATSQETWFRLHGAYGLERDPYAWLLPTYNARPRVVKPPLVTWLHLLSFAGLEPRASTCEELIWRARLTSVLAALLLQSMIFLILWRYSGWRAGFLGSLILASMFFVQRHARTASYDIHLTLWLTVANLLFFYGCINPASGNVYRRLLCALGSGLAAGLSWLSKGPHALLLFAVPAAVQILLLSHRRKAASGHLLLACGVASLPVISWYLYVFHRVPDAFTLPAYDNIQWVTQQRQPWYYYAGFFGLIIPWSAWGLAVAFSLPAEASRSVRRQRLAFWTWFWALFLLFSAVGAKQQRYILPAVPPLAMAIAICVTANSGAASHKRLPQLWLLRLNPLFIALPAAALALVFAGTHSFEKLGWIKPGDFQPLTLLGSLVVLITGLVAAFLVYRAQQRMNYFKAAASLALGACLLTTAGWHGYTHTESRGEVLDSRRVNTIIGDQPLYYLHLSSRDEWFIGHCEGFLFYVRRPCPPVYLDHLTGPDAPRFVLTFQETQADSVLVSAGYSRLMTFRPDPHIVASLWHKSPPLSPIS